MLILIEVYFWVACGAFLNPQPTADQVQIAKPGHIGKPGHVVVLGDTTKPVQR